MSEPVKNPFDLLVDQIRTVVREEIQANANGATGTAKGDRLLDPEEAAKLLSVSDDWLYHNAKRFPFTRKLGPRRLRLSYRGLLKWSEVKKFDRSGFIVVAMIDIMAWRKTLESIFERSGVRAGSSANLHPQRPRRWFRQGNANERRK